MTKCHCGFVEGGEYRVCPLHFKILLEDKNIADFFYKTSEKK